MKTIATLASILFLNGGISEASTATATFGGNTDIQGKVVVEDGTVSVDIDISKLNSSMLPVNCTVGGLKYHLHTSWEYNDTLDRVGSVECGFDYTGNHLDPWLGCSTSSANSYCSSQGGCVNGSSVSGAIGTTTYYSCNSSNFETNPYVCEVGDWSGKYGYLNIDSKLKGTVGGESAFEVDAGDVTGGSVVFHCHDDTRAFCAPFEVDNSKDDDDRPEQENAESRQVIFDELGADSMILLEDDGSVFVYLDLSELTIPDGCGDFLYYRIYNSWDSGENVTLSSNSRRLLINTTEAVLVGSNTTAAIVATPTSSPTSAPVTPIDCESIVGSFYDPTVTCAPDTEHGDYCKGPKKNNGKLCDDTDYSYTCNSTKDRFGCAPGDLSGKYGMVDIRKNVSDFQFDGNDELMIALELLEGKSAVIQCSNSPYQILTCGEWIAYDSGSSSNKDNGTPVWVWIIVAVGVILLIGGGVFLCRRCRSDDSYTKIQN